MDTDKIIMKLKKVLKLRSERKLAEQLGISSPDYFKRKSRGTLSQPLIELALANDIDMNWLLKSSDQNNSIDFDLLTEIIVKVEKIKDELQGKMDPEGKAKVIKAFYIYYKKRELELKEQDQNIEAKYLVTEASILDSLSLVKLLS